MTCRSARFLGVFAAALFAASTRGAPAPGDPVAELQNQYQTVLNELKKPAPVTGLLITEVEPASSAAAAGMKAGDILLEYYGAKIETLSALRRQIADAVARRMEDPTTGKRVNAKVRRGDKEMLINLPREALGIRAVELRAGLVPPYWNPPADARGKLELHWKEVLQTLAEDQRAARDAGAAAAFRLYQRPLAQPDDKRAPGETWIGWERYDLSPDEDQTITGTLDTYMVDPMEPSARVMPQHHARFTFHMQAGNYKDEFAFVVDSAESEFATGDRTFLHASAQRLGERFKVELFLSSDPFGTFNKPDKPSDHREVTAPFTGINQAAAPFVAAALPQKADSVLGLSLLSARDFLARPGYVLRTLGKKDVPLNAGGQNNPAAWQVDLMHCGVVVESYWFTDQRRLIAVLTQSAVPTFAWRVSSEKDASAPLAPATAPAAASTIPAPR